MKWIREFLSYISIIVFVVVIRSYVITPVRVNGLSMYPNLTDGQLLLLEKIDRRYKRFDIVVIDYEEEGKKEKIIKRIIWLHGENISYKNNTLYVNDQKIEEIFIDTKTSDIDISSLGSYTVPANTYFVLGDNRPVSKDSRYIGFIDKQDIDGKAIFSLFPFDAFGTIWPKYESIVQYRSFKGVRTLKVYRTSFILTSMLFIYLMALFTFFKPLFKKNDIIVLKSKKTDAKIISSVIAEKKNIITQTKGKGEIQTVFDGLTLEQLTLKLDKNLNSTLKGKGALFASYSTSLGLDPYLAVAIVLEETGCKWNCSSMVNKCYNIGGLKGSPSCAGTSYRSYNSLDEGIKGFMDILYYNYYAKGLTTPETINPIYAESSSWSSGVRNYITQIKNS